ncbi:MAG: CoA-binding protein [Nanoarchaeota archaeon]
MTIDKLLNPRSIAVIGASRDEKSVGYGILKSLVSGGVLKDDFCKPFAGEVYAINPNPGEVLGRQLLPSITAVKGSVDLAVIAVPAKVVPAVLEECGKKGVRAAIIVSAGFKEIGEEGRRLEEQVLAIAKKRKIRFVGPNCLGVIRTRNSLNASFAPTMPPSGDIAFISQSGALADSIIDWVVEERYGFSVLASIGNAADLDIADFLLWLGKDKDTKAIVIYLEGMKDGRRFLDAARAIARKKPIIVLKGGRTERGQHAISSHTGSLAGSFEVYKAAMKQAGIVLADTVEELFDLGKTLAHQPACKENCVAIVTNGGGCGVLCADYCEELGVKLAELTPETLKKLDSSGKMHPAYSRANPLDIIGDALPERYDVAINTLLSEPYIQGLIVIQTLQTMTHPVDDAMIVINARKRFPKKPVVCLYMGGIYTREAGRLLEANGIPNMNDPRKAAVAMKALVERGRR